MIERRTERVSPDQQDAVIDILSSFGWVLVDSQEVYNESTEVVGVDTKLYGDDFIGGFMKGFTGNDGSVNVRTQTKVTNYVTLQFARDTDMPNYTKLKQLNDEFESKMNYPEPLKPVRLTAIGVIAVALILISIILAIVNGTQAQAWEIAVCIIVPVVFIPAIIVVWKRYKKKIQIFETVISLLHEIIDQAQSLL